MLIISLSCSRMCHHSHFSTTIYCWKTTKNKTYMYWLWGRLHSHWALGTVALCGHYADFVHRNVLMWLITLTWTHADISSYTDDLNKQCRRRAGWADKAEQTKALTASRIHTSYLHNLLYRELHDHPVALWVFEEDILQSPSFCRILST